MSRGPRVAVFTPLPPSETGTAEYAADLIAELGKLVSLDVFTRVNSRLNLSPYTALIYQLANNPFHAPFYTLALAHPGIVVLHEPNLHDLIKHRTWFRGDEAGYRREVHYDIYGTDRCIAEPAAPELPQPRRFSMLRRVVDAAQAVVVHSLYAAGEVRAKNPAKPLFVIPHGASVRSIDALPYRRKLEISADAPVIGIFGYQRPDKRALSIFRAFRDLLARHPSAHLLIAGKLHPGQRMAEWIAELNLHGRVHLLGYQSLNDYDGYLAACDVVLNLRHPTFGETSGTMMRAFGIGRPVIVSDQGAYSEPPDHVCLRIPPDAYEQPVLLEVLDWLLSDRSRTESIGRAAQDWVRSCCTWQHAAQLYANVAAGQTTQPPVFSSPSSAGRSVVLSQFPAGARLPYPEEAFERVTCPSLPHEPADPMQLPCELNRILQDGGLLTLQGSPYGPGELRLLLEDAGFVLISIDPKPNASAIARRDSAPIHRYPSWLYAPSRTPVRTEPEDGAGF